VGSVLRSAPGRWAAAGAAALLLLFLASPAAASSETLKRSISNMLFGPTDIALGPIVGARSAYYNVQDVDDTMGVRVVYLVPGVAWNGAMCMAGGVLRTMTGLIEFIPGLILLPFESDMDTMFAPPERASALIDEETDLMPIKIGINYVD
jgi:prolipoprotein diacylglyceryltransferase